MCKAPIPRVVPSSTLHLRRLGCLGWTSPPPPAPYFHPIHYHIFSPTGLLHIFRRVFVNSPKQTVWSARTRTSHYQGRCEHLLSRSLGSRYALSDPEFLGPSPPGHGPSGRSLFERRLPLPESLDGPLEVDVSKPSRSALAKLPARPHVDWPTCSLYHQLSIQPGPSTRPKRVIDSSNLTQRVPICSQLPRPILRRVSSA